MWVELALLLIVGTVYAQTFPPFYLDSYYNPVNYKWGIWDILFALGFDVIVSIIFIVLCIYAFRAQSYGRFRKVSDLKKKTLQISAFLITFPSLSINDVFFIQQVALEGPFQESMEALTNIAEMGPNITNRISDALRNKATAKGGRVVSIQSMFPR